MGLRIPTNIPAIEVGHRLSNAIDEENKSMTRIASGQRLIHAGDDPGSYSIAEELRSQTRSIGQSVRNANQAISLSQVAEGGLNEVNDILIRIRELGIQAASDTVTDEERSFMHEELRGLVREIDRTADITNFNGIPLLNAQMKDGRLDFQVGIYNDETSRLHYEGDATDVRACTLGVEELNYETADGARDGLDKVDSALRKVASSRAFIGALQNRLQSNINVSENTKDNYEQAHSQLIDCDLVTEASIKTKADLLRQGSIAILAQANMAPAQALKLL